MLGPMFDGFNCTIFTYGQTGAGKSFTLTGVLDKPELHGVTPRIIDDIFGRIKADTTKDFVIQTSYIECYMEKVKDLLEPTSDNLDIKESAEKGIYVAGVTEQYCSTATDVMRIFHTGTANKAMSATKMNATSSRSHSLLCIKID